ncbi:phage tail assembly chaperone [Novosphingobium sp. FSY-8]|uniref:Phage tail assembly chaperone n=1 Tax=Novosphingobium ovatum TaxID=1908523 RepID=A0ABW9XGL9_9SPHN|nr:phage tail assembly chaperone [Novosphingobium ovatum]NBC37694.1 phage tail assembly chaperone [Novosphingobium ovatum]
MADDARFGPGARRLAGLAGRLLGWRPAEFWAATPAELATILSPEPHPANAPLSRAELQRMMERDP